MAENQEKTLAMPSNPSRADTNSSRYKKKEEAPIREASQEQEVKDSISQFLFEKKLTHSDVKGQNRIIIPKAYAEQFFGEFAKLKTSARIFMDDMRTGKVWNFCFRSWQNGASRMYVLEGTGKYTLEKNVQVGDFIMLYKDSQTQKYRISTRKKAEEGGIYQPEQDGLPQTNFPVNYEGKNHVQTIKFEVVDEYQPEFLAPEDQTSQLGHAPAKIDEEYVMKNFNMSWDAFINFNPFEL
ncbi:B3 domain-containing protein LFL1 [Daucus carota subsp. sativus]|uniref:B3 domain-containing protein LFL1 n=1 Tax=Daucus carota subsp. sativus TaxID=79200 RepID=UPI003083B3F5